MNGAADVDLDPIGASDETVTLLEESPAAEACALVDSVAGWREALAPETERLRQRVRLLLDEIFLPQAARSFVAGDFQREIFTALGGIGAIGATLVPSPARPILPRTALFAVMHAVEYADGGLRCALTVQESVLQALLRYGDDEQQRRWVAPLADGSRIASFALTEPDAGSDLRSLATRATRRGKDWILRGRKGWVTSGPVADVLLVWARTSESNDTIRGFLVERGTPGLTIEPIDTASAMRTVPLGRVALDDVRVPESAMLPHAWGLADVNACLDYNRMTVAFGVMGAARFCLDAALGHARTRRQFGVAIGAKQLVQAQLAEMVSHVVAGELLSLRLAERWSTRPLTTFEVSLCKRSNCAGALDVARRARAVLGAEGIDLERHVMRHLLNLEASSTYGGTHEVHALVMGKALTGESAF